jgi:hypothetical protein
MKGNGTRSICKNVLQSRLFSQEKCINDININIFKDYKF